MTSYITLRTARRLAAGAVLISAAALGVALPAGPAAAAPVAASAPPVTCTGNGTDGNRVQALYVYEPGGDQYAQREPWIRQALWEAQVNINDSARRDGAQRWLRYLHNNVSSNCQVTITKVQVPTGTWNKAWNEINDTLKNLGFNAARRIYLMIGEGYDDRACGNTDPDPMFSTAPGSSNPNNTRTIFSRVHFGCFGGHVVTHELTHALGAVPESAPHYAGYGHCSDGQDVMCQNTDLLSCPDPLATRLLDCNQDDYFGVTPRGSYLPSHWNPANESAYLTSGTATTAITTVPPVPPQYLAATNVSGTSVALTFRPPGSAWQPVTSYEVMNGATVLATIPAAKRTTVNVGGLSTQRTYSLTIRSRALVNGVNRVSVNSTPLTFTTGTSATWAAAATNGALLVLTNDVLGPDNRNYAIEDYWSSLDENAMMVLYQRDEGLSQQWRVTTNGGGYSLVNQRSQKCLAVLGGSTTAGAQIVQNTCNSSVTGQRWTFTDLGSGKFQLRSALSSLCVQSQNGATTEFTPLVQATCNTGQPTQRWSPNRLS